MATDTTEQMTLLPPPFGRLDLDVPSEDDLSAVSAVLLDIHEYHVVPLFRSVVKRCHSDCPGSPLTDQEFGQLVRWCNEMRVGVGFIEEELQDLAVALHESHAPDQQPFDENGRVVDTHYWRALRQEMGFPESKQLAP